MVLGVVQHRETDGLRASQLVKGVGGLHDDVCLLSLFFVKTLLLERNKSLLC